MKTLDENLETIENIQHEVLNDDLETLRVILLSWMYIDIKLERLLSKSVTRETEILIEKLTKQKQSVLPKLLVNQLSKVELDCEGEEFLHLEYGDNFFLKSIHNNQLLKNRIHNFLKRNGKKQPDVNKLIRFCTKLFDTISKFGVQIIISEEDLDAMIKFEN